MLKSLIIAAAIFISAVNAQATSSSIYNILPSASVVSCKSSDDVGSRAYHLTIKDMTLSSLTLQVDTLICLRIEGQLTLVPYALAEKQTYKNNGHVISYENIEASLAITNAEATALLDRAFLNLMSFTQEITLNTEKLRVFDVNLQMFEVIRLDGKVVDQSMRGLGSYRIQLNR